MCLAFYISWNETKRMGVSGLFLYDLSTSSEKQKAQFSVTVLVCEPHG